MTYLDFIFDRADMDATKTKKKIQNLECHQKIFPISPTLG